MCVYMYACIHLYTEKYNGIYHLYIKMKDKYQSQISHTLLMRQLNSMSLQSFLRSSLGLHIMV